MITLRKGKYETKVVPTGFSWTTFFFGIFPALIRGDVFHAGLMVLSNTLTLGLGILVWPFVYNGLYVNRLLSQGWEKVTHYSVGDDDDEDVGRRSGAPVYHEPVPQVRALDPYSPQYALLHSYDDLPAAEPVPKPMPAPQPAMAMGRGSMLEVPQSPMIPARKPFGRKVA